MLKHHLSHLNDRSYTHIKLAFLKSLVLLWIGILQLFN